MRSSILSVSLFRLLAVLRSSFCLTRNIVYYHVTLFIAWLTIWQLVFPEKRQKQKSRSFYKLFLEMIFYYITIFYLLEESPYSYSHTDLHEYHGTEIFGAIFKSVHCTTQIYIKDSKLTTLCSDNGKLYSTQNE